MPLNPTLNYNRDFWFGLKLHQSVFFFLWKTGEIKMGNIGGVTHPDKPSENYHPTLQFLSGLRGILVSFNKLFRFRFLVVFCPVFVHCHLSHQPIFGDGLTRLTLLLIGIPWYSYPDPDQSYPSKLKPTQPTRARSVSHSEAKQGMSWLCLQYLSSSKTTDKVSN